MIQRRGFSPRVLLIAALALMALVGCSVYFNLFFNAKKAFNEAEKARKETHRRGAGARDYQIAIEKALKVVENHPNSKYYDDAVYILGVSYFHTEQYSRSERRFRELMANFPESEYAKEATLYLAKAKLALGEIEDAMASFSDIFESNYDKAFKAEAAEALGHYYQEEREYERARLYYSAVRDSLGDAYAARQAQIYIADGYYDGYLFRDALGSYLQALGMDPDKDEKYHILFQAANCSFRLQRINDGLDYLNQLVVDEVYYDSLGVLKMAMGEGYEYDDDLIAAEATYEEVIATEERPQIVAEANYRMGLIYQIDYDDLAKAREYYDKATETERNSPIRADAIKRSSDIAKIKTYAHTRLDSTATIAAVDEAAYTQYLLAELYWSNLNKPDSALTEMQYLIDSFSTSYYAPKAMIALAAMVRDYQGDDHKADSLLKRALREYPHSDFVPEALEALQLKGTAADTGYARIFVDRAEDMLIQKENADSARVLYQYVVDNFPESKFYISSKFAVLWLNEMYFSPGDSSVYYDYLNFADSFPDDDYANLALQRIGLRARPVQQQPTPEELAAEGGEADTGELAGRTGGYDDTIGYIDPMISLYIGPSGDTLVDLRLDPIETLIPFEFPTEAAFGQQYDWRLYFQLLIDFSGRVVDLKLKIPSGIEELDRRAVETVESMTFDAMNVANRAVDAGVTQQRTDDGYWFVYMYTVTKPEYLR